MILPSPQPMQRVFLYGPPGSGKSSLGRQLAQDLSFQFIDLDQAIESQAELSVDEIFAAEGETGFRQRESQALSEAVKAERCVIALGGGALLRENNRTLAEAQGQVLCLSAPIPVLFARLSADKTPRPLIAGNAADKLEKLMQSRAAHYASFSRQLDCSKEDVTALSQQAQSLLGLFHITGMQQGYDVRAAPGALGYVGDWLKTSGLHGPVAVVTDENVGRYHLQTVLDSLQSFGYPAHSISLAAGESHKTMETVLFLWDQFLQAGLDRSSTVLALGGGVVGDLAGFAAATYLRGVNWAAVPTSLLSMVDASLGGKTGADLPQGKNLVGAFHAPRLVLADPLVLQTLPEAEIRNGMAEVIKHGVIGDPGLLVFCQELYRQGVLPGKMVASRESDLAGEVKVAETPASSWTFPEIDSWTSLVRRAMAVKIQVILDDPFEQGRRATLNLGHTLGHAIEKASSYQVKHGEAVAIGTMAVLRAAVRMGLSSPQFFEELNQLFDEAGLPTQIPPHLAPETLFTAMTFDKKRKGCKVRFVLPIQPGEVRWGMEISDLRYLLAGG
jgi:shikimate kinase/3-dehydroquinate synthase